MFYYKTRYFVWNVFLALSVDHPLAKFFENNKEFNEFKKKCSLTGTTEEFIASARKIGFKTDLIAFNPWIKILKCLFILRTLY